MKLYFYRGKYPNFGDELNSFLLPKVFPDFFDEDSRDLFLGIGSVLFDHHPSDCRKIVFGSGYAGYTPFPVFDEKWKIYCVRGPRTAAACGLSVDKVAADAAILINHHRPRPAQRSPRISFMPHWESLDRGHWPDACRMAGLHFLDPRRPVEEILSELETSSALITEAMHGAIVADALRVPWIAVSPLVASHRFKWFDWAEALDIKLMPQRLWPSSVQETVIALRQRPSYRLTDASGLTGAATSIADKGFTLLAAARLYRLAKREPALSSDAALNRALDRLESAAVQIRKDVL